MKISIQVQNIKSEYRNDLILGTAAAVFVVVVAVVVVVVNVAVIEVVVAELVHYKTSFVFQRNVNDFGLVVRLVIRRERERGGGGGGQRERDRDRQTDRQRQTDR